MMLDNNSRFLKSDSHQNLIVFFNDMLVKSDSTSRLAIKYSCLQNNIIPKFLNFHVSNSYLKSLCAYLACQIKLLKEEISLKKIKI